MKRLILVLSIFLCGTTVYSQKEYHSTLISAGFAAPFLDSGIGAFLGVNPSFQLTPRFYIEQQTSYIFTTVNGSFLSGRVGTQQAINALIGPRFYLNDETKNVRIHINLLLGANFNQEKQEERATSNEWGLGLSSGIYFTNGRCTAGTGIESPQHVVFRVGFNL